MPRIPGPPQRVGWLELFFDLVFVVVVAQLTDRVQHEAGPLGWLSVAGLFFAVWAVWNNTTLFSNVAGGVPPAMRPFVFVAMAGVGVLAVSIPTIDGPGQIGFAIGYAVARTAMWPLWMRQQRRDGRLLLRATVFGPGIALLWIASIAVPDPWRLVVWAALLLYELVPLVFLLPKTLNDPGHMLERVGLFVMIVLGESVYELIRELIPEQSPARWITAALGFAVICVLWWLYFESTGRLRERLERIESGAVFRDVLVVGHFVLVLGLVFLAAGLGLAIEVADEPSAPWAVAGSVAIGLGLYTAAQLVMSLRFGVRAVLAVIKAVPAAVAVVALGLLGPALPAWTVVAVALAVGGIEAAVSVAVRRAVTSASSTGSAPRS
jgi:low temperature requirement protein LtrA